ncbi:MAG: excinuclease ABC subunit UvrB [Candidatus Woesearchaeota archaeon]
MNFDLKAPFKPTIAQQEVIDNLSSGLKTSSKQTLLGITGSGKTFVMANIIKNYGKPTLVLAHNKTLAAQLYQELKEFFPNNAVEYFISYYDYYQPESYLPTTDTYIEKDASINDQIDILRKRATASLLSRKDVIIVASVSCIYGLGDPSIYKKLSLQLKLGQKTNREELIASLIKMQYERNDNYLEPGNFRVRADVIDIIPSYQDDIIRIELFGDEIDKIARLNAISHEKLQDLNEAKIFPSKHYVVEENDLEDAIVSIREELEETLPSLDDLEAHRLKKRVNYDIEMLQEVGYCSGIENYSRHFEKRKKGSRPYVLLDFFDEDFLFLIDESHQTLPQVRGMYNGDYARKKNLVDFGFRLPSAFDNRPLKFNEFESFLNKAIFVSATPAEYEQKNSQNIAKLIIRPTGLLDPEVEVLPTKNQIPVLVKKIKEITKKGRVLITTLTKKMAEDLTEFLAKKDIKVRYMHSDINSLDRIELVRSLRAKDFDVLVGINLLREGLDLPEVALVAILDADKEGFLRDERSLIQTMGRAARNKDGKVIMFADTTTKSMQSAINITRLRRKKQIAYNKKHGITPKTVIKEVKQKQREISSIKHLSSTDIKKNLLELESEMKKAAENLDFEKAIKLRDMIKNITQTLNKKH